MPINQNYFLQPGEDISAYYKRTQGQTQQQALAQTAPKASFTPQAPAVSSDTAFRNQIQSQATQIAQIQPTQGLGFGGCKASSGFNGFSPFIKFIAFLMNDL